jgi:DNA-binding NtrC family response regulator
MQDGVPTILVVEGDSPFRRSLMRILERQGYQVVSAATGTEALDLLSKQPIDLVLVDVSLPDMAGADAVRRIRGAAAGTEVIAMTGEADAEVAFQVLREGACDYFEKPISDWKRFYQVIRKNLEIRKKDVEIRQLRERVDRLSGLATPLDAEQLIGNSPAMRELQTTIAQVGPHNVSVLIVGESGSGKERVARALHTASKNRDGPFVAINCAGLQMELLESELFGYERGSHSKADTSKPGLFEVAKGGTVFLDEIGEMPYEMQAKLLRVLNEREFRRVGGTQTLELGARIISATNVDLRKAISEKQFREDLYYRLNVFEIQVPPLRDRKDDIPLLAYFFVQKYNKEYGMGVKRLHPSAMGVLQAYDWPHNNVRELERAIQRAVVLSNDEEELGSDLFFIGTTPDPRSLDEAAPSLDPELFTLSYKEAKDELLHRFSIRYLEARLDAAGGNITQAARLSGVLRPNFAKLMKRFGVVRIGPRELPDPDDSA